MIRTAVVFFNTVLLLAAVEGTARVAEWLHPGVEEIAFDYAPYRMLRMTRAPWPLNREGFRARELGSYRNTFLVEFLGGSVCLGVGANPGKTVPERLEEALHQAGLDRAAVLSLCQGGASSAQELAIFLEYGLPLSPRVVLSFDGANDLLHPRPVGDDESPNLPYKNAEIRARFDHSFVAHLAIARVAGRLLVRTAPYSRPDRESVPPQRILDSYFYAIDAARTLTEAQDGLYAVIFQPSLHYMKPWSGSEQAMWRARRRRDGGEASRKAGEIYAEADRALGRWSGERHTAVFDLAGTFCNTSDTVYSDSVHFSGGRGNAMLFEELRRQGLIERIAEKYQSWEKTLSNARGAALASR